jgi:hypothetical protein
VQKRRPLQIEDLLEKISDAIKSSNYRQTIHALERQGQRTIGLPDVLYVLKTGYHEKRKTIFDEQYGTWKYAIRGYTLDRVELRIIVAFDENDMLIITVIRLEKGEK